MTIKKANSKTTTQQEDYAAKGGKLAEARKAANKGAREAMKVWKAENPDCTDFDIKTMNVTYVRRKGATSKAILELARRMMYPSNRDKTQADLLEDIRPDFPEITLHNSLWQREISPRQMEKIKIIVNDVLKSPISLLGCKTLSDVRKKVSTSRQIEEGARSFKVKITFTNESVIIGKKSYALEKRTSGYCIRVTTAEGKRRWLRMDALAAALMMS